MTTPVNIDTQGIQINSLDNTTNIITSMIGSNQGLSLNYDLLTTPKLFTLTINGFTLGVTQSSFSFVCLLQQLLQALRIPLSPDTLLVNNSFRFRHGSHTATLTTTSSPSRLTIDVASPHFVSFLTNVRSLVLPTTANCLANRQYCNNLVSTRGNVTDNNLGVNYFLLFNNGSNINLVTNLTNPATSLAPAGWMYNPAGGSLTTPALTTNTGNTRLRFGGIYTTTNFQAHSVLFGKGWIDSAEPASAPTSTIAIGNECQRTLVPAAGVAIGNLAARTFINSGTLSTTASINSVSIGQEANSIYPNRQSVAIGARACYTKINAQTSTTAPQDVSIGFESAYSTTATAGPVSTSIGYRANYNQRQQNTLCINATGAAISNTIAGTFTLAPLRGFAVTPAPGYRQLFYDYTGAVTGQIGEIYYSTN